MFAFFNLGAQELIILLLMCLCWGGPILALSVFLFLVLRTKRKGDLGTVAELRSEVERLREDVDRLMREPAERDTTADRPREVIGQMERAVREEPHKREAQKRLAFEVTALVHGQETANEMAHAAEVVYQSEIRGISDNTLAAVFASVPSTTITRSELASGIQLHDALVRTGLVSSKGEARRLLQSGAIYLNNLRQGSDVTLGVSHLASASFIVLRSGKKNYRLVRVQ